VALAAVRQGLAELKDELLKAEPEKGLLARWWSENPPIKPKTAKYFFEQEQKQLLAEEQPELKEDKEQYAAELKRRWAETSGRMKWEDQAEEDKKVCFNDDRAKPYNARRFWENDHKARIKSEVEQEMGKEYKDKEEGAKETKGAIEFKLRVKAAWAATLSGRDKWVEMAKGDHDRYTREKRKYDQDRADEAAPKHEVPQLLALHIVTGAEETSPEQWEEMSPEQQQALRQQRKRKMLINKFLTSKLKPSLNWHHDSVNDGRMVIDGDVLTYWLKTSTQWQEDPDTPRRVEMIPANSYDGDASDADLIVDPRHTGLIVGTKGAMVTQIEQTTGAKVTISKSGDGSIYLSGDDDAVARAKEAIEELVRNDGDKILGKTY
jgi:hypothetical protein